MADDMRPVDVAEQTPLASQTATMAPLYAALAKAQANMGKLIKDADNGHFRSKYATLAAVRDVVIPAMADQGIAVLQAVENGPDGVTVRTVLAHESGLTFETPLTIRPSKNDAHGIGSAATYARRFALMGLAGIAPEDDDGNAASLPDKAQSVRRISDQQRDELRTKIDVAGADIGRLCKAYGVGSLSDMTVDQFTDAMAKLNAKASQVAS